jgi:hypothetical protein
MTNLCERSGTMSDRTCSVEGCGRPHDANGYCHRHDANNRATGNPIPRKDWPLEDQLRAIGWTVTESGCWEWNGKRRGRTPETCYGIFNARKLGYENAMAHRVMYECFVEPIPDGMQIRHKCDNPPCVNPDHLIPGTAADNSRDMVERRRHWRHNWTVCDKGHDLTLPGAIKHEKNANRCAECDRANQRRTAERRRGGPPRGLKVSAEQAAEIRRRRAAGEPLKVLAAEYGVVIGYICNIAKGRSHKPAA